MKNYLKKMINNLLAQRGLTLQRINPNPSKFSLGYISAKDTVESAEKENLSVCDYVEKKWNIQGTTQIVINNIFNCAAFSQTEINRIVEIGIGTGRYLEKVLNKYPSARYESYETAIDWAEWLKSKYSIISHEADGLSLKQTSSKSVDFLHAHGVFVYLPFLISYGYWMEIWRVMKKGGIVAFDIISENCLDQTSIENWLSSEHCYPCFLGKDYVIEVFKEQGFSLVKTFVKKYGEGLSEYLIFYCE